MIGGFSVAFRWLEVERSDETEEVVPELFVSVAEGCFSSVDDVMAESDGRDRVEGFIYMVW